jgi:hypothetical protein
MYVLDYYNSHVQVFSANGVYQRQFGEGHLMTPFSIIITADLYVLVVDINIPGNRIVIFGTRGQLLHSFHVGSNIQANSGHLAIDHNGDLLVTLYNSNQVAVF